MLTLQFWFVVVMQCVDTLGLDLVFVIQMDTLIYGDGVLLFFNDVPMYLGYVFVPNLDGNSHQQR